MAPKAVHFCLLALLAGAIIAEAARPGPMGSADQKKTGTVKTVESASSRSWMPTPQPHLHPIQGGIHPSSDLWRQPWFKGDVWRPETWPHTGSADDSAQAGDAGVSTSWRR